MGCNERVGAEMAGWTSPSSAADPTAWPPPSSVLGPVCRCRFSRRSRRWAAARVPCADPEFAGVSHDICSAVHPLALASPFLAEFDLPARGVTLKVPEVSYANPLPGRPPRSAITIWTAPARSSPRRFVAAPVRSADRRDDGVLNCCSATSVRFRPTRSPRPCGAAAARAGHPGVAALLRASARALFTGVAAHAISQMPSLVSPARG